MSKEKISKFLFVIIISLLSCVLNSSSVRATSRPSYISDTIDWEDIQPTDVTPDNFKPYRIEVGSKYVYMIGIDQDKDVVIQRSSNGGEWIEVYNFGQINIDNAHGTSGLLVTSDEVIVASLWDSDGEYLYRSTDHAATFTLVNNSTDSVFSDWVETNDKKLFLMSYGGLTTGGPVILYSENLGASWDVFYQYPVFVQHSEGLTYHAGTNRLYAAFGHVPEYSFGYCDLDTGNWTWLYTDVLIKDWQPQRAPNSLAVVGDYILAASEPQKSFSTVSTLDGLSYFTPYSTYMKYGSMAASYNDVGYIATTNEGSVPPRTSGIFAVVPESGLWIELIRSEHTQNQNGFSALSHSAYKGWMYAIYINEHGNMYALRYNALTKETVLSLFQEKYIHYFRSRVRTDVLAFFPMTWIDLNKTIINAKITFHEQTAPISDVKGFVRFDDTTGVDGTANYKIEVGDGIYSQNVLDIRGDSGEYINLNISHLPIESNYDISTFLVMKVLSPVSTKPTIMIEFYSNGVLQTTRYLTRGATIGLNGWLWFNDWFAAQIGATETFFKIHLLNNNTHIQIDALGIIESTKGTGILDTWAIGFGNDWSTQRGKYYRPSNGTGLPPYVFINGVKYNTSTPAYIKGEIRMLNVTVPPYGSSHVRLSIMNMYHGATPPFNVPPLRFRRNIWIR